MAIKIKIQNLGIPVGNSRLAVVNHHQRDNCASTLLVSYVDINPSIVDFQARDVSTAYKKELVLAGIPLSVSTYYDSDINPSLLPGDTVGQYYALDIIENNAKEDTDTLDPSLLENVPTDPTNKTFTFNGNRLSASRKSYRYYWNTVNTGNFAKPKENIVLMGIPLAKGYKDELILHNTNYGMEDIDELVNLVIGGCPLTAGRINFKYYLIVSPILESEA